MAIPVGVKEATIIIMKTRALLANREFITENGCSNGGGKGHGIIESSGDDARSVAARGRVSKAAERRDLAIENDRIPEA